MDADDPETRLSRCAEALAWADGLLITAGAGMGVDSGLPDFRGREGFWNAYPALRQARLDFASIACADTFRDDPRLAWGFYGHRLKLYRDTEPHEGYAILKEFARSLEQGAFVYTSNVDGHFQKAGIPSSRIVECHGTIHRLQCLDVCTTDTWPADEFQPQVDTVHCRLLNEPPRCPECGGIARPNLLMFGDWDWLNQDAQTQETRLQRWLAKVQHLVILEIGAGTALPAVRRFSEFQDGFLIRINPSEAELPTHRRGIGLAMPALAALREIRAAG